MIVLIKGIKYKVSLMTKVKYIKAHKDNSYAHLDKHKRELVFRKDHIEKKTIIHEVTHAFIAALHLGSCSEITVDDFEEIICEMMEDHLMDINKTSNEILKFLKEQSEEK